MHPKFAEAVESLHPKFERLISSAPLGSGGPKPRQGVYLFSEGDRQLHVVQSIRVPSSYARHARLGATRASSAALAMPVARADP